MSLRQYERDKNGNNHEFDLEIAQRQIECMRQEASVIKLTVNPYKYFSAKVHVQERNNVFEFLIQVQYTARISDMAFLVSTFLFDKIMEHAALSLDPKDRKIHKYPYRLGALCLYMAAKFEDYKYPYFECYKEIFLLRSWGLDEED